MKKSLYSVSLVSSAGLVILGAVFKIQHLVYANFTLQLGMIMSIPFIFLGVKDVFQDQKNETPVKLMWTIGFIFLSMITGLVYRNQFNKRNA